MSRPWVALVSLTAVAGGLLCLPAAARAENACLQGPAVVGTAHEGEDDGIGGTGLSGGDDSGIGGTGIYGTITNFGSICVNGLRVSYDDDAEIDINGRPAQVDQLAIGQVTWLEASVEGGKLSAYRISVHSAAVGPVEAIDAEHLGFTVSGERVEVPGAAIVLAESGRELSDLNRLAVGDIVDVSGLRRADGHIVASRVEKTTLSAAEEFEPIGLPDLMRRAKLLRRFSIEGYVEDRSNSGRFRLDGVEIDASALSDLGALDVDARVWLLGSRVGDAEIRADRIRVHREAPGASPGSTAREGSQAAPQKTASPGIERPEANAERVEEIGASDLSPSSVRRERPTVFDRPERPAVPERPERLQPATSVDRTEHLNSRQ